MSQSMFKSFKALIVNRRRAPFAKRLLNGPLEEDVVEEVQEAYVEEECPSEGSDKNNSLDNFDLIRMLGRGGFAKVILAELRATKELYAIKIIKKTQLMAINDGIDFVQTEKRVFESARTHPYLVGLHSCFQTSSRLFFVMEFVRGGDLTTLTNRHSQLPENQARFYAAEVGLALHFLHQNGIIYRDLKLDNVLLDHEGHIKLADYGLCKVGMYEGNRTTSFCGTPMYMAPEVIQGINYNFSADWWALGVILFQMLCGRSPFIYSEATEDSNTKKEDLLFEEIVHDTIQIPRVLSHRAASVLEEFLCKEPAGRLGSRVENSDRAFEDVKRHQFFNDIDWELLQQRQVLPPFKPRLESDMDLSYFPTEFTEKNIEFTPDEAEDIEKINQEDFEGFESLNYDLPMLENCI